MLDSTLCDTVLRNTPVCAVDTETTGLDHSSRIVELAAVKLFRGEVIDEFNTLINPLMPIPEAVIDIHGITNDMVREAPVFNQIADAFVDFIGDYPLIAHSARFDAEMLMWEFARSSKVAPQNPFFDSCSFSRNAFPNLPNYKLITVSSRIGLDVNGCHRALKDAKLSGKVFFKCVEETNGDLFMTFEEIGRYCRGSIRMTCFPSPKVFREVNNQTMKVIHDAISSSCDMEIMYSGGSRRGSLRKISPKSIYSFHDRTYIDALCHDDGVIKRFRVDRIENAKVVA